MRRHLSSCFACLALLAMLAALGVQVLHARGARQAPCAEPVTDAPRLHLSNSDFRVEWAESGHAESAAPAEAERGVLPMRAQEAQRLVVSGQPEDVDRLLRAIEETQDPEIKNELADAFRRFDRVEGMSLLVHGLARASDAAVVRACRNGLANLGPAFVGEVLAISEKADTLLEERIAETLGAVTDPDCVLPISKVAMRGLAAGRVELAGAAVWALAQIGTPEAQEQIVSLVAMPGFPDQYADVLQQLTFTPVAPALSRIASGEMGQVSAAVRAEAAVAASRFGYP